MTQEEKELLLKDLCGRLPYGVMIEITSDGGIMEASYDIRLDAGLLGDLLQSEDDFKPYLRPINSMTKEEKIEYDAEYAYNSKTYNYEEYLSKMVDWLNTHHLDYRGLIPMGLALEAPEGMYGKEEEK